jgi:putative ABC transport system permease protein
MLAELVAQSWRNLRRQRTRSLLTMLGIVWGIVAVAVLMSYGRGFRAMLLRGFDAFGKSAVVCWPGQTSAQAGGERAGRRVVFEKADRDQIRAEASLVKSLSLETVRTLPMAYGSRVRDVTIRGVEASYGEIRNEVASEGRWISPEDELERRRVVFIGGRLRERLFSGRPAVGETVRISGVRFTVIGTMSRKIQLSSYFNMDEESAFIPYSSAGDLWSTRYADVLVFSPVLPSLEHQARLQVRAAVAKRQRFNPGDERTMMMIGREQFRPIIDGLTIGLQGLLLFIGTLTLTIGGVGVANIMLVSVDERIREIGLRRALGARKRHIRAQFLAEALVLTLAGGAIGIVLAWGVVALVGSMPGIGTFFNDTTGQGDLHLVLSLPVVLTSTLVLLLVGTLSGLVPALKASRLDPVVALRYE